MTTYLSQSNTQNQEWIWIILTHEDFLVGREIDGEVRVK